MTRKRGGQAGGERERERRSDIGKRASGTYVDREGERQSATVTMSLGADGEGGIGGSRAGLQGGRQKERERERATGVVGSARRRTRSSTLGPDGSERDGISQPEECLSRQRRSSETGLVQSSQISPWEGDFLSAVRVLLVGLTSSRLSGPVFRLVLLSPSAPLTLSFTPLVRYSACAHLHPPDNVYPEARVSE